MDIKSKYITMILIISNIIIFALQVFAPNMYVSASRNYILGLKIQRILGRSMNDKAYNGETPLHIAVKLNKVQAAEYLVKNGVDVNAKNNIGETPLHYSARKGNLKLARLLLNNNANVNIISRWKTSPLDIAILNNGETAELIKMHGGKYANDLK